MVSLGLWPGITSQAPQHFTSFPYSERHATDSGVKIMLCRLSSQSDFAQ